MKKEDTHLVLGARGAVGMALINELKSRKLSVLAASRSSKIEGFETINFDLRNSEDCILALQNISYVYLCVGLEYDSRIWADQWPSIIENIVKACEINGSRLIFLDNVYMYKDPLKEPFDESSLIGPSTRKGKIRAAIANRLLEAHHEGKIRVTIGRSADFFGPGSKNSILYISFLERMLKNKNPQFIGSLDRQHSFAFTIDIAKALIELAIHDDVYGEVWHLPVCESRSIQQMTNLFNKTLRSKYITQRPPRAIIKLISLFSRPLKEVMEMIYQFDNPYIMSDIKFRNRFPSFRTTEIQAAVDSMVEYYVTSNNSKSPVHSAIFPLRSQALD